MPLVVVVETETETVERIRVALAPEGWTVSAAADRRQVLTASGDGTPTLFIVSTAIEGAETLLAQFARRRGGPGTIALVPAGQGNAGDLGADGILTKPFSEEDLSMAVRSLMASPISAPPPSVPPTTRELERKLTSDDIFGDVLAEVGAGESDAQSKPRESAPALPQVGHDAGAVARPDVSESPFLETDEEPVPSTDDQPAIEVAQPSATVQPSATTQTAQPDRRAGRARDRNKRRTSDDDLDQRLERTLSGLLDDVKRPAKKPTVRPQAESEMDIDALLERTLSGVGLPAGSSPKKPPESPDLGLRPEEPASRSEPGPPTPATETPSLSEAPVQRSSETAPALADVDAPREPVESSDSTEPVESTEAGESTAPPSPTAGEAESSPGVEAEAEPGSIESEAILDLSEAPALPHIELPAETLQEAVLQDDAVDEIKLETPPPVPPPGPDPIATQLIRTQDLAGIDETASEEARGRSFGQYDLLERISAGGMAEVWKARMTGVQGFQKTVAVKRILSHLTASEDFVRMLIDEAKLAAQLNHPHITHIYDLGKIGDEYFIAMEYVHGRNLRMLLNEARDQQKPLPSRLALLIGSRVASALDYAHRKRDFDDRALGLVHRDVSPQNVLISYEGEIKLCDFGIVKAVAKAGQTQMGALKGKLQYMSPEQAWGQQVDPRSDVFSLGVLLYEMLTGERLFTGENEMAILEAVRDCRVVDPRKANPAVSEAVSEIVLKALAKEPENRFSSAGELQRSLEAAIAAMPVSVDAAELSRYMRRLFGAEAEVPPPADSPQADLSVEGTRRADSVSDTGEQPSTADLSTGTDLMDGTAGAAEASASLTTPDEPAAESITVGSSVAGPEVDGPKVEMPEPDEDSSPFVDYGDPPAPRRGWLKLLVIILLSVLFGAAIWYFFGPGAEMLERSRSAEPAPATTESTQPSSPAAGTPADPLAPTGADPAEGSVVNSEETSDDATGGAAISTEGSDDVGAGANIEPPPTTPPAASGAAPGATSAADPPGPSNPEASPPSGPPSGPPATSADSNGL